MIMAVNPDLKTPDTLVEDDKKYLLCVKRDGNVFGYRSDILREQIPSYLNVWLHATSVRV